jgi:hypothetical protein
MHLGAWGALLAVTAFVLVAVFRNDDTLLMLAAAGNALLFLNLGALFVIRGYQMRKLPDR